YSCQTLSPYTTLFRSVDVRQVDVEDDEVRLFLRETQGLVAGGGLADVEARRLEDPGERLAVGVVVVHVQDGVLAPLGHGTVPPRSEEHTSELQSQSNL